MELETKVELRKLAVEASQYYLKLFYAQDNDHVDGRTVNNLERAIDKRIDKISDLSNVSEAQIRDIIYGGLFDSLGEYFKKLRNIGVPIATIEETENILRGKLL